MCCLASSVAFAGCGSGEGPKPAANDKPPSSEIANPADEQTGSAISNGEWVIRFLSPDVVDDRVQAASAKGTKIKNIVDACEMYIVGKTPHSNNAPSKAADLGIFYTPERSPNAGETMDGKAWMTVAGHQLLYIKGKGMFKTDATFQAQMEEMLTDYTKTTRGEP
jgi:hypothetical protein